MRVLAIAVSLAVAATAASAAEMWFPFKDPASVFSIDVPGTPTVGTDNSTTAADGSVIPIVSYEVQLGAGGLVVGVSDLAKYEIDPGKAIDGCVATIKQGAATVQQDQLSVLDGQVGREIIFVDKQDNRIDDRIYFVRKHLYQAITIAPKDATAEQIATDQHFLASFHFTLGK